MNAMDAQQLAQAAGALIAVLGLLLVFAWALRLVRQRTGGAVVGRLSVIESLILDARHRLVRIGDGDHEHLLLLGPQGTLVVATRPRDLPPPPLTSGETV
ncbi:MAG: hypothetical protein EA356_02500 [Geminicoccaceae bacterium]|nr:MAG: hypothetical protein EA356_02500 [Geminicoccaceae bacterium]